jgi:hypothetical protein
VRFSLVEAEDRIDLACAAVARFLLQDSAPEQPSSKLTPEP